MTSLCVLGLADSSASKSTQLIRENINKHRYTIHSEFMPISYLTNPF